MKQMEDQKFNIWERGQLVFFLKWLTEENENTPHMTRCFKTQIVFY